MAALPRNCGPLRCNACQRWLLSAFIPELAPRSTSVRLPPLAQHRRRYTTTRPLRSQVASEQPPQSASIQEHSASEHSAPYTDATIPDGYDATSDKPWYLQVQEAQFNQPDSIAAKQQLPELPDDPPTILDGLLDHLSVDIGLDYLSLLDLRSVDPPPAFGSNLIMIFGTARSEKHLNVSANRFCRWLRTQYKLRPYADGLLGRNEFKLKMRRKLRKTKILSAAGARDLSDTDDGIATGWVCVNVGSVDEEAVAEEELGEGAIGFSQRSHGTKLVVQMMTEDKRGELDLEGLWTGILKGSLRRQTEINNARPSPELTAPAVAGNRLDSTPSATGALSQSMPSHMNQQVRSFHSTRARPAADSQSAAISPENEPDPRELEPHLLFDKARDVEDVSDYQVRASRSGPVDETHSFPPPASPDMASDLTLRTHLAYLDHVSEDTAFEMLGQGENDKSSTTFLQSFYDRLPLFLGTKHWDAILELHSHGLRIAHPSYTQAGHVKLLHEMAASGATIPAEVFQRAVESVLGSAQVPGGGGSDPFHETDRRKQSKLRRNSSVDPENPESPSNHAIHALRSGLGYAFDILDLAEAHGHEACTEQTLLAIHRAITSPRLSSEVSDSLTQGQLSRLTKGFHNALDLLNPEVGSIPRALIVAMLTSYSQMDLWQAFWQVWHLISAAALRHDEQLYQILFEGIVAAGDRRQARRVINEYIEQMGHEAPPVHIEAHGELALAVARSLRVAGYDAESEHGKWARIWELCRKGIVLLPEDVLRQALNSRSEAQDGGMVEVDSTS